MAGETLITIIGNLTNDPELRFSTAGQAVCNFTIASTPRTYDKDTREWTDGETLFLRAAVWRDAAQHCADTLSKGMRVIAHGKLKARTFDTKEGERRTVIDLDVEDIGPSLRHATAQVTRIRTGADVTAGTGDSRAGGAPDPGWNTGPLY